MVPSCRRAVREPVSIAVMLVEVAVMLRTILFGLLSEFSVSPPACPAKGCRKLLTADAAAGEQIAALIEQFQRPGFAERQAASQQLEEVGLAAFSHLKSAAASAARETSARALDILRRHFQTGADEIKVAAMEVLLRLAQSDNASTAQKARNILDPPKEPTVITQVGVQPGMMPPPINNFGGFGGGRGAGGFGGGGFGGGGFGGAFGGNLRAIVPGPGGIRRVSISDINGRKVLDIDERERRIRMETGLGGRIDVEVTDKQNARNPVRKLDAVNVADLKRKDAELGRLYEQFFGPARGSPRRPARAFSAAGPRPRAPAQRTFDSLEQARQARTPAGRPTRPDRRYARSTAVAVVLYRACRTSPPVATVFVAC